MLYTYISREIVKSYSKKATSDKATQKSKFWRANSPKKATSKKATQFVNF